MKSCGGEEDDWGNVLHGRGGVYCPMDRHASNVIVFRIESGALLCNACNLMYSNNGSESIFLATWFRNSHVW